MKTILSVHWALAISLWYFGNGLLHDIMVLAAHKGSYNRELLRLLMDGHVLMLSGAVVFVCYLMLLSKIQCGGLIGILVAAFMILYCIMIYPFLSSYVTLSLSLMLILVSVSAMRSFPNIWEIMKPYREA